MSKENNPMEKFEFLLGEWALDYHIPQSTFSRAASGTGNGVFQRIMNDKYVTFDYECSLTTGRGLAHAIFAWDSKVRIHRYWWFEDSGNFASAVCRFLPDDVLYLHWNDILLTQSFTRIDTNNLVMKMEHPLAQDFNELIMKVTFTRK